MKRVLVTGATGFIGRHCLPYLVAAGYEIHALTSRPSSDADWQALAEAWPQVTWHAVSMFETEKLERLVAEVQPTHLLHLAWELPPKLSWDSPKHFLWMEASLKLLLAFHQHGGQRCTFSGTGFEYDARYGYCSESLTPKASTNLYGTTKHCLQSMTEIYCQQHQLSYAWGRVFFLYGPYEAKSRLVASIINALLDEAPARCSHGNQIRDYLHVADAASALVALLDSDVTGPVNIGSGTAVTLKQIIYAIGDILGKSHLIELGALPSPPNEPALLVAQVERLQRELKWLPQYSLDHGLRETVAWWQSQRYCLNMPGTV